MASKLIDRPLTAAEYEELAREYQKTLPLEHYLESFPQGTQRKLALESLDVLGVHLPHLQVFNELLIQYVRDGEIRRVVPDNMVRLAEQELITKGSFNFELEPVAPLWVLEWVSSSSEGKDYGEAFEKYERDLKIPYCLLFHYDDVDLKLYHHGGRRYKLVEPNAAGRLPLPELDLEVGLAREWVRFWHRGELLPLPDELVRSLRTSQAEAKKEKRRASDEKKRRVAAEEELARLRAELEHVRGQQGPK